MRRLRCRFSLGRSSSGARRRAPTATGRLRPGTGGSGGWCITSAAVPPRTAGQSPRRCCRTAPPGRWGIEKACLVDVIHLCERWHSWTTMVDIAFPRDRTVTFIARRAKSVAVRSSCINPRSVLPSCTCLSALAW